MRKINPKELERLINDGLSSYKISQEMDSSPSNVRYWMNKLNLSKEKLEKFKCKCGVVGKR